MTGAAGWITARPGSLRETIVWRVDLTLDTGGRHACHAALSEEERARAERFVRREDSDRYAASHAALRRILAGALGADPSALLFRIGAAGKPELDGPWRGRLDFNLSHSGRIGLVALSPDTRVGVDVECLRPIPDCLKLARHHFASAEIAALARLPKATRQAAFYGCWTCKEAFVKAMALGLSFPLDRFVVAIDPAPTTLLSIDGSTAAARKWSLRRLDPAPGYIGAVAIEGPDRRIALRSLEIGWATTPA